MMEEGFVEWGPRDAEAHHETVTDLQLASCGDFATTFIHIFRWYNLVEGVTNLVACEARYGGGDGGQALEMAGELVGYSSPVQSGVIADLEMTTADYSLFGSLLTVGQLIGSLACGKLTDYLGRRGTMGLSGTLHLIGWLVIAFSQRAWSLDLGRFTQGLAGGVNHYVIPVYIAEITPKNLRGGGVLLHQLMICCGISYAYLFGLVMNWRALALLGAIPCLVQLLGLLAIPESPRWLVKVGDDRGCEANLKRLRGKNTNISEEANEIKEYTQIVENISDDKFHSLFRRKHAYVLTVSLGLMTLSRLGGTEGVVFYATTIFESAGFSGAIGTIAMATIQLPPTILGVFLMDNFGRRPLLLSSAVGMCTACFSLALSFLMKEHGWMKYSSPYLALFGILIWSAVYPVGLGGIPYLIMSEIFPMNIKAAAGSLSTIVGALSTTTVSYTFNFLMDWSSSGTFFMYGFINICCLLFISILVPETKGRTLEELQKSLCYEMKTNNGGNN